MIDKNKIEDNDWEILRDNFTDQALDMSTDELADYYANYAIDNIKKHDRMYWFNSGVLPCKKCNEFNNDCECDEESEVA